MKEAILIGSLLFGLVFALPYGIQVVECASVGANTNKDYKYSFFSGCYIKATDGTWLREQRYRGID